MLFCNFASIFLSGEFNRYTHATSAIIVCLIIPGFHLVTCPFMLFPACNYFIFVCICVHFRNNSFFKSQKEILVIFWHSVFCAQIQCLIFTFLNRTLTPRKDGINVQDQLVMMITTYLSNCHYSHLC